MSNFRPETLTASGFGILWESRVDPPVAALKRRNLSLALPRLGLLLGFRAVS